ncbi:hypothetical protein I8F73_00670 [Enterococcus faecalis]|nr:hypothetical protein [Enterococcus faecalis]
MPISKTKHKQCIEEFDGLALLTEKVNEKLTVSENIGGCRQSKLCIGSSKNRIRSFSIEEFFVNWATIWRTKAKKQYQQLLLQIDVHAPAKLRANVQPKTLTEFYETFWYHGTRCYVSSAPPEKRVRIW